VPKGLYFPTERRKFVHRIFGPVPSRRLGRSLGIDVIPHKTCSFDCVYCECGATTNKTCKREEFYPLEELLEELDERLSSMEVRPDYLTLSGAGEPTLYSRMGELIRRAKEMTGLPVAVITNSSLLHMEDVRRELMEADVVLPSLDAARAESFIKINRPHRRCDLAEIMQGLKTFLSGYKGKVLFEVLLIDGYNTEPEDLEALKEFLDSVRVDRIQLNTVVRPGTIRELKALGSERLEEIREFFGPKCEIVASGYTSAKGKETDTEIEEILSLLKRRPCTLEDIHNSTGIPIPGLIKTLDELIEKDEITTNVFNGKTYYTTEAKD